MYRLRGGKATWLNDPLDPSSDTIEDAHPDEGNYEKHKEWLYFYGMFQSIQHKRANLFFWRARRCGWIFTRKNNKD